MLGKREKKLVNRDPQSGLVDFGFLIEDILRIVWNNKKAIIRVYFSVFLYAYFNPFTLLSTAKKIQFVVSIHMFGNWSGDKFENPKYPKIVKTNI